MKHLYSALLLAGLALPCRADTTVVFNEISRAHLLGGDWVELYNQMAVDMDISGWTLENFQFPPGTIVPGRGFLVVATEPATLTSAGVTNVQGPVLGFWGRLTLRNNNGRPVDSLDLDALDPWPEGPIGARFGWAKRDRDAASAPRENWVLASAAAGTPGRDNFPTSGLVQSTALIKVDQTWKYYDAATAPAAGWQQTGFADAAWSSGKGLLYHGTNRIGEIRPVPTLYNTGLGTNGQVLTSGAADPHYRLTVSALGGAPTDATVTQNHPNWLANDAGSSWIGPLASGSANAVAGNFYYQNTFSLAGFDPQTVQVQIQAAADNSVTQTLLNGNVTPITASAFNAYSQIFYLTNGFVAGNNTLEYRCSNGGADPTGLRVLISGTGFATITNTPVAAGRTTYYYRTPFVFAGDPSRTRLLLRPLVDDGAVVYLNGEEILRLNLPEGALSETTPALANVANPAYAGPYALIPASLVAGTNVLAVEVHQAVDGGGDMVFGLEVSTEPYEPPPVPLVLNEVAAGTNANIRLELFNHGNVNLDINGWILHAGGRAHVFSGRPALPAGGFLSLSTNDTGLPLKDGQRVTLWTPNYDRVKDVVEIHKSLRGRYPDGTGEWLWPAAETPGASNLFVFRDEIVINEILYHPPLLPGTNNLPPQESGENWLELYNRSTNTVDLTGWILEGGVSYVFPPGTMIPPDGYLVLSDEPEAVQAKYPGATVLGSLGGRLSGKGELITLRDPSRNPADQVYYHDGGHWPEYADGGGSSLELRNPGADNAKAAAWAASDETGRAIWQSYSYRAVANFTAGTQPTQWNDFVFGLLGGGECLVDDLAVIESPDTAPVAMIANGNFENGSSGWRIVGNHGYSRVETDPDNAANHVLHLKATGPQEHMHNHIETTLANGRSVVNGREYQISFRARWLAGNNLLNTRLYFNRAARTTALPMPALHGTPGARNSRYEANIGPTFAALQHTPVVPQAGETVTVSVTASDPQSVTNCSLWWSVNSGAWNSVQMPATNGVYHGVIPGQAVGSLVQFYVRAADGLGVAAFEPPAGPDSGALYAVQDGQADFARGHNFRIILSPANRALLHAQTNVMSNDELPATLVYDEYRAYYDIGIRLKGSERGRFSDTRASFHLTFQPDNLFRGVHPVMLVDRSGAGDSTANRQLEIVIKHVLHHAGGIPGIYSDLCKVIAPLSQHTGSAILSPRHEDEFIETEFNNGGDGNLYELELIYYPTTTNAAGYKNPNPDAVLAVDIQNLGDDKELYRYNFMKKNHRETDDYTSFIKMAKAFSSGAALDQQTRAIMDMDEWLRAWALVTLCGVSDSYTFGNIHNLLMYERPKDGQFQAFPVDMDFSFVRAANSALIGNQNFSAIINLTANRRRFYAHVQDIIASTYNNTYLNRWISHYNQFVPEQNYTAIPTYLQTRIATANTEIAGWAGSPTFAVSGSATQSVGNSLLTLAGTAPIGVVDLRVNGLEVPVTWTSATAWQIKLALAAVTNDLAIQGYDVNGLAVTNALRTLQVVYTNAIPSPEGLLGFSEIMFAPAVPGAEYVELYNASAIFSFDLTGWRINGLDYTFSPGAYLAPRGTLVLVKNRDAFIAAYGSGVPIFDDYDGNLQATGETLTLLRPDPASIGELVVDRVRYEPEPPWPTGATATGSSLQLLDNGRDHSRPLNWSDGTGWRFASVTITNRNVLPNQTNLTVQPRSAGTIYIDDLRIEEVGIGSNTVVNGDFESPLAGTWVLGTNVLETATSTEFKHSGNSSLKLVASARAVTLAQALAQPLTLASGKVYTISFWFLPSPTVTNVVVFVTSSLQSSTTTHTPVFANSPGAPNPVAQGLPELPPLYLNEVQPENLDGAVDNFGDREPWVELYNRGSNAVSLDGYGLADNYTNLAQWAFPAGTVIAPGEFLVVWADGETNETSGTNLHTSFRLAPTNGSVVLAMPWQGGLGVLDYLNYRNLAGAFSFGKYPDGQMFYRSAFYHPTPGATNDPAKPPVTVVINEWMADNTRTLVDPADGQHEDWIELYNYGTNPVNLAGCFLSDDGPGIGLIPEGYVIPPRGFLIVWADAASDQNRADRPDFHAYFRLNRAGENIYLYDSSGALIDHVLFGGQVNDVSQGRFPDGAAAIAAMSIPTPRATNQAEVTIGNTAPLLGALPDRRLLLGQTLAFTATATDPEAPPQTLVFSLAADAPPGAGITPAGNFSWTPVPGQIGTNLVTIIVTDDGSPAKSATNSFAVWVGSQPQFAAGGAQVAGGQFTLQVAALDGLSYRLEFKNNLSDAVWETVGSQQPVNGVLSWSDTVGATNRQRFYRVIQVP